MRIGYLFRAMKLLLPHRGMVALYLVCSVFLGLLTATPLVLGKAWLDHLGGGKKEIKDPAGRWLAEHVGPYLGNGEEYVYSLAALIVACVLLKAVFDFLTSYLQGWIAIRLTTDASVRLMRHLLVLDVGFFDRRKLGDLVSRMTGDTAMLRVTAKMTLDFLQQPPEILILAVYACSLNPHLFLLGVVGVPVIIVPLVQITRRVYKHAMRARERAADMAQDMLQNLTGLRTVQAYGAEVAEGDNFGLIAQKFFQASMRRVRNRAMQRPLAEIVMGLGGAVVLIVGSLAVMRGEMPLESFLFFLGALGMLASPMRSMLSSVGELAEFVPSAERTFEILDTLPKIVDAPGAVACPRLARELVFEDVAFDYGRGMVFQGLNLRVQAGERIGIVGRTGVGKSTLLALVLRFYDPAQGRVSVDGQDIAQVTLASLRGQIALVTQDPFLFHSTIEENIRYGRPHATFAEVEAAAKAAAIHDEIAALPQGYQTTVGERGVTLSGGQRQRVAVARAILRDAPILLLDEATSALDSASERRVQEALDQLSRGRTSLIVAHRLSTIRDADRIVVFGDSGGIEAVAPHAELLRVSPAYRALWERQSSAAPAPPEPAAAEAEPGPERRPAQEPRRALGEEGSDEAGGLDAAQPAPADA